MSSMLEGKELVYCPRTHDLDEFERLGTIAKEHGFTHLCISTLKHYSDFTGENEDSPWCDWSGLVPSIFEFVTPPGLEDAYPEESVKTQFEFLKAKHDICEKLGMRASFEGLEPHWLNERVFQKHPSWRGSRCDNSLRAVGMYYSPDSDHPEVRDAYRTAVKMLLTECPRLDYFSFYSNDSGAFYNWDKRLFTYILGPTHAQGGDMGLRVQGFLMTLREGAKEAGVDAHVFCNVFGWFNDDETHLVLRSLVPGIGVNGLCPGEHQEECSNLNCGGSAYMVGPYLDKQGEVMAGLLGGLAVAQGKAKRYNGGGSDPDYFKAFDFGLANEQPNCERERIDFYYRAACHMYGEAPADDILDCWLSVKEAQQLARGGGVDLSHVHIALRWATRPLVAHQDLLTEEERSYWEPYIYQSKGAQPDMYLDYLNLSGYDKVNNWHDSSLRSCAVDGIEAIFKQASDKMFSAAEKAGDEVTANKLKQEAYRLLVSRSFALTSRSFMQVGVLNRMRDERLASLEEPMPTAIDQWPSLPKGDMQETALWYMERAIRWELENVYELIELIPKAPEPLFHCAPNESFECSLLFEHNVVENISKKAEITRKHFRDAEIGFQKATLGG